MNKNKSLQGILNITPLKRFQILLNFVLLNGTFGDQATRQHITNDTENGKWFLLFSFFASNRWLEIAELLRITSRFNDRRNCVRPFCAFPILLFHYDSCFTISTFRLSFHRYATSIIIRKHFHFHVCGYFQSYTQWYFPLESSMLT